MKAVVLAAGKGVRMKSDLPKVVHAIQGKPLVLHVVENLRSAGVDEIICVVGYKAEIVRDVLGTSVSYVMQHEQLGTGHAVLQAEPLLRDYTGNVIVACGDAPFISSSSFGMLINEVSKSGSVKGSVLTATYDNPTGYGRIIKNSNGYVIGIVEEKDADAEVKKIKEVNTGTYVFDSTMLFEALRHVDTDNAQNEYYLPDTVSYINKCGYRFSSVCLHDNREGMGINTRDELEKASEMF